MDDRRLSEDRIAAYLGVSKNAWVTTQRTAEVGRSRKLWGGSPPARERNR